MNIAMHFKGEEEFLTRIEHCCESVEKKQTLFLTEFLNPYQQQMVEAVVNSKEGLQAVFNGGISGGEYARCVIAPDYYEIVDEDFNIHVYKIIYQQKFDHIVHKDVLGALMNLGLKRELFGDIAFNEGIYFAVDSKMEHLLSSELLQVRHSGIRLKLTDEKISMKYDYMIKTYFVSSLRLDILLSHFYKHSRSEINKYIQAGFVKVNHKIVVENSYLCNNNDVISFKKHGRVKVVDTMRISKGNNKVVEGHFYK